MLEIGRNVEQTYDTDEPGCSEGVPSMMVCRPKTTTSECDQILSGETQLDGMVLCQRRGIREGQAAHHSLTCMVWNHRL